MTRRPSFSRRREIDEQDLQEPIDVAVARAQRFLNAAQVSSASVQPQSGSFTPYCLTCEQRGRKHKSHPTFERHYVCTHCDRRWAVQPLVREKIPAAATPLRGLFD